MGKKYIIDLPENTYWIQWIMEGTINNHPYMDYKQVEDLTPYTEPDMEQVRKEAYDTAYADAEEIYESGKRAMYQKGLKDAWEAARKICTNWVLPDSVLSKIFGTDKTIDDIMKESTASEAIEKIRAYEQRQEEIKVGDEVAFHHDDGRPDTVVVVTYIGQDGFIDGMDGRGTQYAHKNPKKWTKTGRHFPEIAEVLAKMKEES